MTSRLARCFDNFIPGPLKSYSQADSWKICSQSTASFPSCHDLDVLIRSSRVLLFLQTSQTPVQQSILIRQVTESLYHHSPCLLHPLQTLNIFFYSGMTMSGCNTPPETGCTGWLKIKYPTGEHAISPQPVV